MSQGDHDGNGFRLLDSTTARMTTSRGVPAGLARELRDEATVPALVAVRRL